MPISKPETGSSSDIELPVLTSHYARSFQPLPSERAPFSNSVSETNPQNGTANSTPAVNGINPPTPAYSPSTNDIPPIPSFDAGLLEYTRLRGHSEIPLSPRQPEDDRTSVHASEAPTESLPAYRVDHPPNYFHRRRDSVEPITWPTICFRIGFRTYFH
jgi:hypothetical protein